MTIENIKVVRQLVLNKQFKTGKKMLGVAICMMIFSQQWRFYMSCLAYFSIIGLFD